MTEKHSKRRKAKEAVIKFFMYAAAAIIILTLASLIGYIVYRGMPKLTW